MEDGDHPDMPGWDVTAHLDARATPPATSASGRPTNRLMLTGDCVLPRITPNVNLNPQTEPDPLGDYLRSLEQLAAFDAVEALPAHEWRYVGHRARLLEIRAHHEQRFVEVIAAIRAGYDTAWEVAPAHGLVAPVGPDRRLHAPLRHRRGLRAPPRARRSAACSRRPTASPPRWAIVED